MDGGEILVAQPNLKSLESASLIMYGAFGQSEYVISDIKNTITWLLEDDRQKKNIILRVLPTVDNCKPELTDVVVLIANDKCWNFNTSVNMWEARIHTEKALKILLAESDKSKLEGKRREGKVPYIFGVNQVKLFWDWSTVVFDI